MNQDLSDLRVVLEQPGVEGSSIDHLEFRQRKSHRKSRAGCLQCKRRRVKCDETRPKCVRCTDNDVACTYPPSPAAVASEATTAQAEDLETVSSHAVERQQPSSLVRDALRHCRQSSASDTQEKEAVDLLEHLFNGTETTWIGSPLLQNALQRQSLEAIRSAPWVLSTLLAFSAAHLSSLHPDEPKYSNAVATYYAPSLSLFRSHLGTVPKPGEMNARLEALFMHAMLAFFFAGKESAGADSLEWFPPMIAIRSIRQGPCLRIYDYMSDLWDPILERYSTTPEDSFATASNGISEEDREALVSLREACSIDTGDEESVVATQYSRLKRLLETSDDRNRIDALMCFIACSPSGFFDQVKTKQPEALLLLSFWYALFKRVDQWWIQGTAKAGCQQAYADLKQLNRPEFDKALSFLEQ